MPVVMFVGSGCIDLVFGWYSKDASLGAPGMQMAFASVPFTLGGVVGLAHQIRLGHGLPKQRDVIGGLLLGVTNFASLYFLLLAFDADLLARAMVIPLLNLSVIVLATVAGVVLLNDHPNQKARWGVAMAIASSDSCCSADREVPVDGLLVCVFSSIATRTLHRILPRLSSNGCRGFLGTLQSAWALDEPASGCCPCPHLQFPCKGPT